MKPKFKRILGNFGVPFDVTAKAAAIAVHDYFMANKKTSLEDVRFVDVNPSMFQAFDQALKTQLANGDNSANGQGK